jgi:hypothetical protein
VQGLEVYTKYAKATILASIGDNLERDVEPEAIKAMQVGAALGLRCLRG